MNKNTAMEAKKGGKMTDHGSPGTGNEDAFALALELHNQQSLQRLVRLLELDPLCNWERVELELSQGERAARLEFSELCAAQRTAEAVLGL